MAKKNKVIVKNGKVLKSGNKILTLPESDSIEYAWCGGKNPKLISQYEHVINLGADTTFKDKTVTTSAQSVKATTLISGVTLPLGDLTTNDYIIIADYVVPIQYTSQSLSMARPEIIAYRTVYAVGRRHNSTSETLNYNISSTMASMTILSYRNNSNTLLRGSASYGVYPSAGTAPTISSSTASAPYISKLYTPAVSIRANTGYADISCFEYIDADNTNVKCRWQVYELEGRGFTSTIYGDLGTAALTGEFSELAIPNAEISVSPTSITPGDEPIEDEE